MYCYNDTHLGTAIAIVIPCESGFASGRDLANGDSQSGSPIRLITTILDPERASAGELAAVYHQRWEFESSLAEIETRQRGSYRVLRSHNPEMVRQEIWALLLTHYAI